MRETCSLQSYRRTDGWLAHEIRHFTSLTSTNDVLRELAQEGVEEGLLVLTEEQTAGRGRQRRRWLAPPQTCLLMSLLFRPRAPFAYHASRLTMNCGLGLLAAVRETTGLPVTLKWPNDLILERDGDWKKIAGMLSEVAGQGPDDLIVGIGLNVNVAPAQLAELAPRATSLLAELGHPVDRRAVLATFLQRTEWLCDRLRSGWDPLSRWRERVAWMGRSVEVITPNEVIRGVAETIDDDGALVLRQLGGERRRFSAGDVSVRQRADAVPMSTCIDNHVSMS